MNCFECALRGETVAAVATCSHCGIGLCLEHLRVQQAYRVGGTTLGCPHNLSAIPAKGMAAGLTRSNGKARVRVGAAS